MLCIETIGLPWKRCRLISSPSTPRDLPIDLIRELPTLPYCYVCCVYWEPIGTHTMCIQLFRIILRIHTCAQLYTAVYICTAISTCICSHYLRYIPRYNCIHSTRYLYVYLYIYAYLQIPTAYDVHCTSYSVRRTLFVVHSRYIQTIGIQCTTNTVHCTTLNTVPTGVGVGVVEGWDFMRSPHIQRMLAVYLSMSLDSSIYIVHWRREYVSITLYRLHYTPYTVQSASYTIHYTPYTLRCIHCKVGICTPYTVHIILYIVQCTTFTI